MCYLVYVNTERSLLRRVTAGRYTSLSVAFAQRCLLCRRRNRLFARSFRLWICFVLVLASAHGTKKQTNTHRAWVGKLVNMPYTFGRPTPRVRSPALLIFCVEVRESFCRSLHRFHGSFHSFHESFRGSFRESFHGRYGSFHGKKIPEAFTEAFGNAFMEIASTKAFTKASTEVHPRKLPRLRKLPRKTFHGFYVLVPLKQAAASTEGRKLSGFHQNFHESFS